MENNIRTKLLNEIHEADGKVGLCLSGGIDSTAVLEALLAKGIHPTCYVAQFNAEGDQVDMAREVANYYQAPIEVVDVVNFISELPRILVHFPTPQWNLWPWFVMKRARENKVQYLYLGEGGDELFGYGDRGFLAAWAGQLAFVFPAWAHCAEAFDIQLHAPFMDLEPSLDFRKGLPPNTDYFKPFNKELLREAYKDILPEFVLNRPSISPSGPFYAMVARELDVVGASLDHIKIALQRKTCEAWLEAHK